MGALQGVNYLIPIIVIPLLIERVGVEKYGYISLAQAIVNLLVVIGDYGLSLTGTKLYSKDSSSKTHSRLIGNLFMGKMALWLIVSGLFLVLTFIIPTWKELQLLLLGSLTISLGHSIMPVSYFQGIQKMGTLAILMVTSRLLYLAGIVLFIHTPSDFIWVNSINGLSLSLVSIVGFAIAMKRIKSRITGSVRETIALIRSNTVVFLSIGTGTFYRNIPLIIAGFTLSDFNLGIYSIIDKLIQLVANTYSVIFRAVFPIVCQKIENGSEYVRKFFLSTFSPLILVSLVSGIVLVFWGADLLLMLDNSLNSDSLQVMMRWLAWIPLIVLINVMVSLLILGNNFNRLYLWFHLVGLVAVALVAPLSYLYGMKLLVASFVIAELSMLFFGSLNLKKKLSVPDA